MEIKLIVKNKIIQRCKRSYHANFLESRLTGSSCSRVVGEKVKNGLDQLTSFSILPVAIPQRKDRKKKNDVLYQRIIQEKFQTSTIGISSFKGEKVPRTMDK